ncbi:MAG: DUF308 domain-containing protein [Candidatus Fimenecus sp.]
MNRIINSFNGLKLSFILYSILSVILGFILCVWPIQIANFACYLIGGVLAISGCIMIIRFFNLKSTISVLPIMLIGGGLLLALGIFLMFEQARVLTIIPKIYGVIIIVDGLVNVQRFLILKQYKSSVWLVSLIFSMLSLVLGFFFILKSMTSIKIVFILIGLTMIIDGIVSIIGTIRISHFAKFETGNVIEAEIKKDGE